MYYFYCFGIDWIQWFLMLSVCCGLVANKSPWYLQSDEVRFELLISDNDCSILLACLHAISTSYQQQLFVLFYLFRYLSIKACQEYTSIYVVNYSGKLANKANYTRERFISDKNVMSGLIIWRFTQGRSYWHTWHIEEDIDRSYFVLSSVKTFQG